MISVHSGTIFMTFFYDRETYLHLFFSELHLHDANMFLKLACKPMQRETSVFYLEGLFLHRTMKLILLSFSIPKSRDSGQTTHHWLFRIKFTHVSTKMHYTSLQKVIYELCPPIVSPLQ